MNLELHHVSLLCDNFEETLLFYRDTFHLQVVTRVYQEGLVEMALLSDRSPIPTFLLALHGQPLSGWPQDDFKRGGAQLNAMSFVTDNLDEWIKSFANSSWIVDDSASSFLSARVLSLRDPSGVNVDLMSFSDPGLIPRATSLSRSAGGQGDIGLEYQLSSISLNCRNTSEVANEAQFYTEELSLTMIRDNPDLVMLSDNRGNPNVGLDLFVAEPRIWEADGFPITQRRPGLHYLCFMVKDLAAAHRELTQKGVECTLEPTVTEHYDGASYRDPSGVDIIVSSTLWPVWGDGFIDQREAPYQLSSTG